MTPEEIQELVADVQLRNKKLALKLALTFVIWCLPQSLVGIYPSFGSCVGAKQTPLWDKGLVIGCHRSSGGGHGIRATLFSPSSCRSWICV